MRDGDLWRAADRHMSRGGPDADGESITITVDRGTQRALVDCCVGDDTATVLEVEGAGPLVEGSEVALTADEAEEARGEAEMRMADREAAQREDSRPHYDEHGRDVS